VCDIGEVATGSVQLFCHGTCTWSTTSAALCTAVSVYLHWHSWWDSAYQCYVQKTCFGENCDDTEVLCAIIRDQPNSWFHGPDIFVKLAFFREKCLFPCFCEIRDFSWILTFLLSFMKVFRVLSTAFVWILLFAMCRTSALISWHVFIVLLTSSLESWLSTVITIINIRCSEISNVLFDRFLSLH